MTPTTSLKEPQAAEAMSPSGERLSDEDELCGADLKEFTKAEVSAFLRPAAIFDEMSREDFLAANPPFAKAHAEAMREACNDPWLLECTGGLLAGSFPEWLRDWPVWYVCLPSAWSSHVAALCAVEGFFTYVDQNPRDPWDLAQWLALLIDEPTSENWPGTHVRVTDRSVQRTISSARHAVTGVSVVFECAGTVVSTAYPIDEWLHLSLQAGDGASMRKPLFDHTVAELQQQVRDLYHCGPPAEPSGRLSLQTFCHFTESEKAAAASRREAFRRHNEAREGYDRLRVHYASLPDGGIGVPAHILNYVDPPLLEDERQWLRLSVDEAFFDALRAHGAEIEFLKFSSTDEEWPPAICVLVQSRGFVLEARMHLDDATLAPSLATFAVEGTCRIAFEDIRSGYVLTQSADWPTQYGPQDIDTSHRWEGDVYGIFAPHPTTVRLAKEKASSSNLRVALCTATVVNAEAT